jgi:hypothetical protein
MLSFIPLLALAACTIAAPVDPVLSDISATVRTVLSNNNVAVPVGGISATVPGLSKRQTASGIVATLGQVVSNNNVAVPVGNIIVDKRQLDILGDVADLLDGLLGHLPIVGPIITTVTATLRSGAVPNLDDLTGEIASLTKGIPGLSGINNIIPSGLPIPIPSGTPVTI